MGVHVKTQQRRGRGFTFAEMLFAVMILGMGMILIAGIFPVAVRQTQQTVDNAVARETAQSGVSYVAAVADEVTMPVTDGLMRFEPALWEQVRGNAINNVDSRYAWVPFYQRDTAAPEAEVVVVGVRVRNGSGYEPPVDVARATLGEGGSLEAKGVRFELIDGGPGAVDLIRVVRNEITGNYHAFAEGVLVVVGDDGNGVGGAVHRVGVAREDLSDALYAVFELSPEQDVTQTENDARGYVIGRPLRDPTAPYDPVNNPYEGPAQEVDFVRSSVRVR